MVKKYKGKYCGVPQCKNFYNKEKGISMHRVPAFILKSPLLKKKWMHVLRMGKEFPKNFFICSTHFLDKYIITSQKSKLTFLSRAAFPTENLPSSIVTKRSKTPRRILQRIVEDKSYEM